MTPGFASFYNGRILINVSSQSSLQHSINASVRQIDVRSLPQLNGSVLIYAFNISIVPFNSTVVTVLYGQNAFSNAVSLYLLANDKWTAVSQYSVNQSGDSISFNMPSDPVVGIFEAISKATTVTTVNTTSNTTSMPSTISSPPTTTIYQNNQNKNALNAQPYYEYIVAVVVIVVAAVLLYLRLKRRGRGMKSDNTPVSSQGRPPEQQNISAPEAPEQKTPIADKPQEGLDSNLPDPPK